MANVTKNLRLDTWYKIIIAISSFMIIASFFVKVIIFTNQIVITFFSGTLLFSLGYWKKRRKFTFGTIDFRTGETNFVKHKIDLFAWILKLIGLYLIWLAIYSVYQL